jgi:ABC-2 type transport system permease protein
MFANMLRIESTKLFKRRLFWIEMGLVALLMITFFGVLFVASQTIPAASADANLTETLYWPGALITSVGFGAGGALGGIVLIVLVSVVVGSEYSNRTLTQWLSRGAPRPVVLFAKFALLMLAALLTVLVAALVGAGVSALVTLIGRGGLPVEQVNFGQFALGILRVAYTMLPYMALTFMLAVVTRSTAGALGGGLGFMLIIEMLIIQVLGILGEGGKRIAQFAPGLMTESIGQLNAGISRVPIVQEVEGAVEWMLLPPGAAAVGLALYTVLFLTVAVLVFRKQDLHV